MDLTIRQLQAFLAVADERSFSAAAKRLHTAQSNVSRIVAEIEALTRHSLIERTTRSVALTDEGSALADSARRILEVHRHEMALFAETLQGVRGSARIATLPSIALAVLPTYYERMSREHPGIRVELHEGAADELFDLLLEGAVHMAVGRAPVGSAQIASEPFISDHFVALVSESSPLASRADVTWADLASLPFVALSSETSVRQLADATFEQLGLSPDRAVSVPNTASVAGMVAHDLGVSALPALTLGLFDYPGLVRLPLTEPPVSRELRILYRRDLAPTRVGQRALDVLRGLREDQVPLPVGATWTTSGAV